MHRTIAALTCLCVFTLVIGCKQERSNEHVVSFNDLATAAINHYYETEPSCLWFEPKPLLTAAPTAAKVDPETLSGFKALAAQGLLTQTTAGDGEHFQLSEAGRPYFRPDPDRPGYGNLCYGKSHVQQIGQTRRHHDQNYGDVTDVEYTAALSGAPVWTATPAIRRAFPKMALELSQPLPEIATLKNTDHGWSVAVGPASALP